MSGGEEAILAIAREVQQALLPEEVPAIQGLDLSGATIPANAVGGDYFDFLAANGALFAVVADVMGKGLKAAFLMLGLRSTLRSIVRLKADHRAILEHLNAVVGEDLRRNGAFATLCLGTIYAGKGRVVLTNAGHCPPLLVRDGRGTFLPCRGVALGLLGGPPPAETLSLDLAAGDVLLFYTDGLVEARSSDGQRFGRARLAEAATAFASLPAQTIKERLLELLEKFTAGGGQRDDVTLAVVKLQEGR